MEKKIEILVEHISNKLQELEELMKKNNIEKVEIKFPRGFIRRADDFRNRLTFIRNDTLKTNIAYSLMLTDVYRWILNRFDIAITAQEMLIKEAISLLGNIIEAILKYLIGDKNAGVDRCCTYLVKKEIITHEQKKDIRWLWSMRCKAHLANLPEREYQKYTLREYNKAILIWREFEKSLTKAKTDGKL